MAPIHDAAMVGNMKEVMRLVLEDPDGVDARDDGHDFTALYYACSKGHAEVACYLLHHDKVDVNRRVGGNQTLTTALHGACGNGSNSSSGNSNAKIHGVKVLLVEQLLLKGADPSVRDAYGWTPLMLAAMYGPLDLVLQLLKDPRVISTIDARSDDMGETALTNACSTGRADVVRALLRAGADPMVADNEGETPMDIATHFDYSDCVRALEVSDKAAALTTSLLLI